MPGWNTCSVARGSQRWRGRWGRRAARRRGEKEEQGAELAGEVAGREGDLGEKSSGGGERGGLETLELGGIRER